MTIDIQNITKIAHLARLKMTPEEIENIQSNLNRILDWVEELEEVSLDNVEPLHNVAVDQMRRFPDEITDGGDAQAIVSNSPQSEFHMFSVPKVVE